MPRQLLTMFAISCSLFTSMVRLNPPISSTASSKALAAQGKDSRTRQKSGKKETGKMVTDVQVEVNNNDESRKGLGERVVDVQAAVYIYMRFAA